MVKQNFETFYYQKAAKSREHWQIENNARKTVLDVLLSVVKSGESLLEVGCGTGELLFHLPKDIRYTGLDMSGFAIENAKNQWKDRVNTNFIEGEISKVARQEFDHILSVFTIEHVRNPKEMLAEMVERLKRGGYLFLVAPNLEFPLSFPNALRHKGGLYRVWFFLLRSFDYILRILGFYKFRVVKQNYTELTGLYEKSDDDLRYVVSTYEVVNFLKKQYLKLVYSSKFELRQRTTKNYIKKIITHLPAFKYFGTELCLVFKKEK